ncbi:phage tail protein [Streptomyces antibioticus]|uniref:phage tail protein n=1 Tax=Streptomyces antibioticus TaxID=1890 RepID=UPI003F451F2C
MPAGQVIGRVSVRVLPDTSEFRRKAQKDLDRIEKQLEVRVELKPVMGNFVSDMLKEIRKLNQQNRSMDSRKVRIYTKIALSNIPEELRKAIRRYEDVAKSEKVSLKTTLDTTDIDVKISDKSLRDMTDQLKDWRDRNSPQKIDLELNWPTAASAGINARLGTLTRPRTVSIIPTLNNAAVAKVAASLAALSGARVLNNMFEKFSNILRNLDKSVPIIGSIATAIAGVAGWGIAATSNLAALSASLAQIGAVSLTLPGILGGFAVGLGITVAALKDFNKEVPQVKARLAELQDQISSNFWAQAREPIRELVDELLPRFAEGFKTSSTEIGKFFGAFATDLTAALDPTLVDKMFGYLNESITTATGGTKTFASIIAQLGEVGASYLPNLAGWFVNISKEFDTWLKKKGQIGLKAEIDQGIQSLKDLGGILYETGGILAGISRAATEAGGSTLGMLRQTLGSIHDVIDSSGAQDAMRQLFYSAHQAMSEIAATSGPQVKNFLKELVGLLTDVLPQVGAIIGTALGAVTDALADPAVTEGIKSMFDGIQAAVTALAPAMAPLGQAFGALLEVVATFATMLGPLVAAALTPLAEAFTTLVPVIQPLITMLGGALLGIIQQLAPLFAQLVAQVAPLIEQLVSGLAPILPPIVAFIGQIMSAVMPLIEILLNLVSAVITPLLPMVEFLVTSLLPPLGDAFTRLVEAIQPFLQALLAVVDFIMPVLVPIIEFLIGILVGSLISAINGVALIFEGLKEIFVGVWEYIKGYFMVWIGLFKGIFTGNWDTLIEGLKLMWHGIWTFLKGLWDTILGGLITWLSVGVLGAAKKGLVALKSLWKALWTEIKALAKSVWIALETSWKGFCNQLKEVPQWALSYVRTLFSDAWSTITAGAKHAWTLLKSAFKTGVKDAVSYVRELPGKAKTALAGIGTALVNAGKDLINGFIKGIKNMFGSVKDTLGGLTDKLTSWKGPESLDRVLLVGAGQLVINGFIKGLESRYSAVRKSLRGLTADVAGTQFDVPGVSAIGVSGGVSGAVTAGLAGSAGGGTTKVLNYYAAPGSSLGSEEDLFAAANRARFGW